MTKLKRKEVIKFFEDFYKTDMKGVLELLHLEQGLFRTDLMNKFNELLEQNGYENRVGEKWLYTRFEETGVERREFDYKTQLGNALKKRWEDPKQREELGNRMKSQWEDTEYQEKMREQTTRLWEEGVYVNNGEAVRECWKSEEYRNNIIPAVSKSLKERWKTKEFREKMSKEFSRRAKELYDKDPVEFQRTHFRKFSNKKRTKIEVFVKNFLDELAVAYQEQKKLEINGRVFIPDFFLGDRIIEVNGDYFHVNPEKNYETLSQIQLDTLERDKRKYTAYKSQGIKLLIIWEREIKRRPEEAKKKILNFLEVDLVD